MTKNQEQTPWKEMSYDQKEAIRKAHAEGKKIQYSYVHGLGVWYDDEGFTPDEPPYNFLAYRIAPDQGPRSKTRLAVVERQELVAKAVRWTLCTDTAVRSAGGSGASAVLDMLPEDALYALIANDLFILHLEGPDHLSISLSSEDMDALRELAQERDTSPEELAARWLSVNIQLMAD